MYRDKLKASLIHLALSIILVAIVMGSILFFFFPQLFISVTDFKEVAILIISVVLILGPILTFVVFRHNKKSLKFDMSVIAMIQLSALTYGAYALYLVHPVFITFNVDRFTIVNARDAEPEKAIFEEYNISKFETAKFAFAKMPEDIEQKNELILTAAEGGKDLDQRVEYYEPYAQNINNIVAKGLDPELIFSNSKTNKKIRSFKNKHQKNIDNFAFLPINSTKKEAIIVLDKTSAKPVATIDTDPWELTKK